MPTQKSYTVRELAVLAGVSKSTVSLALRNDPSIAAATRAAVQALCRKLGYRPNPLVGAFLSHRRAAGATPFRGVIAMVSNWPRHRDIWYLAGARTRAAQLGFSVTAFHLRETPPARLHTILETRGIPAVVLLPLEGAFDTVPLSWERFATVAIGYSLAQPELDRVYFDHLRAAADTFARLAARGYRRIGLALTEDQNLRGRRCWSYAFADYRTAVPPRDRVPPLLVPALDAGVVREWVRRYRPDVVLGMQDEVLRLLRAGGCRVPADVAYLSLYLTPAAVRSGAAGWDPDFDAIGAAAVDLVTSRLYRNERGVPPRPQLLLVPPRWTEGRTLRGPD